MPTKQLMQKLASEEANAANANKAETLNKTATLISYHMQVVNYSESRTAEEICESSSKMITFMDLAGHHKYLKTTVFGLTSYCPDFAMLVVSANTGIGESSLCSAV